MSEYHEHPELPPARQDGTDTPPRTLAFGLAGVAVIVVLLGALVAFLFPASLADRTISGKIPAYPAPRLQTAPQADMTAFFIRQRTELNGLWWIDRSRGRFHLPIADAMRLTARDGIPDWPTTAIEPSPTQPLLHNGAPPAADTVHTP